MLLIIREPVKSVEGILRCRELPADWDEATYLKWWQRMTERDRERYTVWDEHNLITTAGSTAINAFLGSTGSVAGFALYFAVSTGPFSGAKVGDLHLANEVFRKQPVATTIIGNVTDVSTYFAASEANYTYTDAGLWGGSGASGTLGSGTLNTHVPFAYPKTSANPISCDYALIRN